ncbi:hypothetical protein HY798_01415 [Candidatus Falkowbacteria bacterium]|nr:hypothetical protein [Candidatus Falkowbacteria bacterium]
MVSKEITTKQLSQQINTLEGRFDTLEGRFDTLVNQVSTLTNHLDEFIMFTLEHVATKDDLSAAKEELRGEMNIQKLDIIDRIDVKFTHFKGELTAHYKASDKKFNSLIELLRKRKGINRQEATRLLGYSYSKTAR